MTGIWVELVFGAALEMAERKFYVSSSHIHIIYELTNYAFWQTSICKPAVTSGHKLHLQCTD